jgi:hypothetical protein
MAELTEMQSFFLNEINNKDGEMMSPNYLAVRWYEHKGKHRCAGSRDSFGQTSSAYRTCRKLIELGLVEVHNNKTVGGYRYILVSKINS